MTTFTTSIFLLLSSLLMSQGESISYEYFEEQRSSAVSLERRGNADFDGTYAYCHLTGFLAFSRAADTECNLKQSAKIYRELAAMYLAIQHFNTGNGVVVPEIDQINEKCPIRFTAELVDSKYTPAVVVQSLTQIMGTRAANVMPMNNHSAPLPCGVVGARTSSATGPGAVVSGVYQLPHMSYTATSPELNDAFRYPLFSRVVTSDDAAAKAALRYMTENKGTTHVAVLYINDPFGIEYNKAFQSEALHMNVTVKSFPLDFPPDADNIQQIIRNVKDTGYRHIYMIIFSSFIEQIMLEAQAQGVTGPDYSYLLGISTSFFEDAKYTADQAEAFEGMGVLPEFGAKPRTAGYDRFVKVWNQLGPDDVAYFNTKLPLIAGRDGAECYQAEPDFFTKTNLGITGDTAPFAYDTIMAMGLGACAAWENSQDGSLQGTDHTNAIVEKALFEGATGYIQMDPQTRARDPLSFSYAVLNVQATAPDDTGMVTFSTPESYLIRPNDERTDWVIEKTGNFFYSDGTNVSPPSLPRLDFEYNQIGQWRILGLILCGIVLALSVGLALWSWVYRSSRAVSLSQPPFLIMICVGTFVIASTMIPISMDDEHYDENTVDSACMVQPWLASIGFVTVFSALYSKTSRILQIMANASRFRTVKVSEKDVLVPFFALMTANVAILLCWTFLDPLVYRRTPDQGTDEWNRVVSSTGRCLSESDYGATPYLACLAAVNLGAVVLANYQAYRARDLSDDLSESKYIGLIMMCLLQTWLTGGPVLFLVYDHPISNYVVVCMICFLTCTAILGLIFLPKMMLWRAWKEGRVNRNTASNSQANGNLRGKKGSHVLRGSSVSGLQFSHVSNSIVTADFRNSGIDAVPECSPAEEDDPSKEHKDDHGYPRHENAEDGVQRASSSGQDENSPPPAQPELEDSV